MTIDSRARSETRLQRPHVYYLEMIVGPMFSGKSEELIRRVRRAMIAEQEVKVFYPAQDTRTNNGSITSRNGMAVIAEQMAASSVCRDQLLSMPHLPEVVAFDEAQFFDAGLVALAEELIANNVRVIVAALDLDFAGRPFGPAIPHLLAIADRVDKLTAVCAVCGSEAAVRTQRLVDGLPATKESPLVLVGDSAEGYEARCLRCYEPPI
ncbi:MAG TPA: thymidine kinase [Ktedonobacterales bacterium]|nr:thymidine kinase [Ktedonobacterales bacterium]